MRPIVCEVGVLPRAHGSALFTRGETQALVVTTLGTGQDEQIIDALAGEYREPFMLHYNFPPYSVGETGRMGSPGRREIGHGKLAWRAVHPLLPAKDKFPYTIRVVSEITESNGSSSMASVCGCVAVADGCGRSDAGTGCGHRYGPDQGRSRLCRVDRHSWATKIISATWISRLPERKKGITSLQMDIKITSITEEIMRIALGSGQATAALHILGEMAKA